MHGVGANVGSLVGVKKAVGTGLGDPIGLLGDDVGLSVSDDVGVALGEDVGAGVGATVG